MTKIALNKGKASKLMELCENVDDDTVGVLFRKALYHASKYGYFTLEPIIEALQLKK